MAAFNMNNTFAMDPTEAFRQGLGSVNRARMARVPRMRESSHESEDTHRIAHTLAACCRCRQRKTRCDPTLPRCMPCERAGAQCEYHDTAKGKKMSRTYVIRLQDKVRSLESQLAQYVDEDMAPPKPEDSIRPGGLVRLDENDETPRYLGPSSGIAMTRLVMEEAKKYTDRGTIRELVPEVVTRRTPAQSPDSGAPRKRSYPMISAVPARELPSRLVTAKLVEVFNQKAQYLLPTLHEPTFAKQLDEVYEGDSDPYKNFIVRMVLAISMQKLDTQYAGLADSYYLAAMAWVEQVIQLKDIRTVQCLVLIAQYSLLTPTRTAIYYIVGLATRLCQQLGFTEEKSITQGVSTGDVDPLQLDMRRRLAWIVLSMEFGLSHSLGRPNAFATGEDHVDVGFFECIDDQYITPEGIKPGPVSEKKTMAVHFFKMRLLQAEIRRVLYQRKRPEPKTEDHPWFPQMENKLNSWLEASPPKPSWSKGWFTSKYNTMVVFLYRPSPQIPKPSVHAATRCYEASAQNITLQNRQMEDPALDITWIFLQSLFMALNTLLWCTSYRHIREEHTKEELEGLSEVAISIISRCRERWPGSASAADLYTRLSKACLKAYEGAVEGHHSSSSLSANSPASLTDAASPQSEISSATNPSPAFHQSRPAEQAPQFGYVFNQAPDNSAANEYHKNRPPPPVFRTNSIFSAPPARPPDRRFSYFPPESTYQVGIPPPQQHLSPPIMEQQHQPRWGSAPLQTSAPMQHSHSIGSDISMQSNVTYQSNQSLQSNQSIQSNQSLASNHTLHPLQTSPSPALSATSPIPILNETSYFMNPQYNFGPQFYAEQDFNMPDRAGSLSYSQQRELMDTLESDPSVYIDGFLGMDITVPGYYYDTGVGGGVQPGV